LIDIVLGVIGIPFLLIIVGIIPLDLMIVPIASGRACAATRSVGNSSGRKRRCCCGNDRDERDPGEREMGPRRARAARRGTGISRL